MFAMVTSALQRLAARIPQPWRRRLPMRLRNALVARLGHPAVPFDATAYPTRVNLGAGYDRREGYLNVDLQAFHDPDLVGDVRSLPELPSGRYVEVLAQDVLEHLERADAPVALREWRRLLAPGGQLWLRVPDMMSLQRWLADSDDADRHRQIMHWLFGTQAYVGDFHLSGYTDVLLCDELRRAGFVAGEFERRDGWLWEGAATADGSDAQPVMLCWGLGFHTLEHEGEQTWRWAAQKAELMLHTGAPGNAELRLVVDAGQVHVRGLGVDTELAAGEHTLALTLQQGTNRLRFDAATQIHAPGDERELAFRLGGNADIVTESPVAT
jgi:hypothetical protein